jgi:hypothetical protein
MHHVELHVAQFETGERRLADRQIGRQVEWPPLLVDAWNRVGHGLAPLGGLSRRVERPAQHIDEGGLRRMSLQFGLCVIASPIGLLKSVNSSALA